MAQERALKTANWGSYNVVFLQRQAQWWWNWVIQGDCALGNVVKKFNPCGFLLVLTD